MGWINWSRVSIFIGLLLQLSRGGEVKDCVIEVKVCIHLNEPGFININHVTLASWQCKTGAEGYVVPMAYVTADCKHSKLFGLDSNEGVPDISTKLHKAYQQTPYSAYFIVLTNFINGLNDWEKNQAILEYFGYMDHSFTIPASDEHPLARTPNSLNCKMTNHGMEYRGRLAVTQSGKLCQLWKNQYPNKHPYSPPKYDVEENFCRNPDNNPDGPWCYIADNRTTSEDRESCNIPFCTTEFDKDGLVMISQKGLHNSAQAVRKLQSEDYPARIVTYSFKPEPYVCVPPMDNTEREMLDHRQFGFRIRDEKKDYDYTIDNAKMHVIHDSMSCDNDVVGWQYIPANPGILYFAVLKLNEVTNKVSVVGKTKVAISRSKISDDLRFRYVCTRDKPIQVSPTDVYGFYTDDSENQNQLPLIKRVLTTNRVAVRYPCGRQYTWADTKFTTLLKADASNLPQDGGSLAYEPSDPLALNVALRPIQNIDFVYTCGCTNDTQCQLFGDMNMHCVSSVCFCAIDFVYNAKANRCVYSAAATAGDTSMSSVLMKDNRFAANKAVDDQMDPAFGVGTYAKTNPEFAPWWVVDIGYSVFVYGVSITTPEIPNYHAFGWKDWREQDSGLPPDFLFTQNHNRFLANSIQALEMVGPFPFLLKKGHMKTPLNFDLTARGRQVMKWQTGLDMDELNKVYPVVLEYHDHDDVVCVGIDEFGQQIVVHVLTSEPDCSQVPDVHPFLFIEVRPNSNLYSLLSTKHPALCKGNDQMTMCADGTYEVLALSRTHIDAQVSISASANHNVPVTDAWSGQDFQPYLRSLSLGCVQPDHQHRSFILNTSCALSVILRLMPVAKDYYSAIKGYHKPVQYTPGSGEIPYSEQSVLKHNTQKPCFELGNFPEATDNYGTLHVSTSNGNNAKFFAFAKDMSEKEGANFEVAYSYPDLANADIGVSNSFNRISFAGYKHCVQNVIAVRPGHTTHIDCTEPVEGQYVGITMKHSTEKSLALTNVQLYTLTVEDGAAEKSKEICAKFQGKNTLPLPEIRAEAEKEEECSVGFHKAVGTDYCSDTDECLIAFGGCSHKCVNTPGAYYCECPAGFQLSKNQRHCNDINECLINNGGCHHLCHNNQGSYYCQCEEGTKLHENGRLCLAPNSIHLRSKVNSSFEESYKNGSSKEHVNLHRLLQELISDFICADIGHKGACYVNPLFLPTTDAKIGFDIYVNVPDTFPQYKTAVLVNGLSSLLSQHGWIDLEGKQVDVGTPITLIDNNTDQGEVTTACDFLTVQGFCKNGGSCAMRNSQPICKCIGDFYGQSCEVLVNAPQAEPFRGPFDFGPLFKSLGGVMFMLVGSFMVLLCICRK